MKTSRWMAVVSVLAGLMCATCAWAGDLTPPGAPGPTMHTLEEIYLKQVVLEARLDAMEQRMATDGKAHTVDGMVLVPAGEFRMGDAFSEGEAEERPVHALTVSALYMDQYEVTKARWDEVAAWAATNGYDIILSSGSGNEPSHPVYDVDWYECVKWANARSELDNKTPCYYTGAGLATVYRSGILDIESSWVRWDADGYRLPTEAEWEKAARGGATGRRFPWADANLIDHYRANYHGQPDGYSYDTSLVTGYHPAFYSTTAVNASPVGSFAPNGYGLYDVAGNLEEWCWDWHGLAYYANSPGVDPHGPASGSLRIKRGGDWFFGAGICRVAARLYGFPNSQEDYLGFRLVRSAQ